MEITKDVLRRRIPLSGQAQVAEQPEIDFICRLDSKVLGGKLRADTEGPPMFAATHVHKIVPMVTRRVLRDDTIDPSAIPAECYPVCHLARLFEPTLTIFVEHLQELRKVMFARCQVIFICSYILRIIMSQMYLIQYHPRSSCLVCYTIH